MSTALRLPLSKPLRALTSSLPPRQLQRQSTWSPASSASPAASAHEEELSRLAKEPLHPLTLVDLVRYGRPPLNSTALLASANFALSILPARLAHRIQAIRNLPFIVATNPHIAQIHNNYLHSFDTLLPLAERRIESVEDEEQVTSVMAGLVQTHAQTIPVLSRGLMEARRYISPAAVTRFLDEHLRARIGTRLVAEQQVALHYASKGEVEEGSYIGIIDTALRPAAVIRTCEDFVAEVCELNYGVRPTVVIDGEPDTCIAHIPVHLQYILTELLKNAFRATIENGHEREPVQVTIAPAPEEQISRKTAAPTIDRVDDSGTDFKDDLSETTAGVTIRIRDRGGGVSAENLPNLWTYGFTTFNETQAHARSSSGNTGSGVGMDGLGMIAGASAGGSSLAGLGYGLPLGRAYAEYFGGGIALQSLWGWGTDVYLTLRGVGRLS